MSSITLVTVYIFNVLYIACSGENAYKFIHEYAAVTDFNPKYLIMHERYFQKYNKTHGAFNSKFTIKKEIANFVAHIEGLVFKNNEFKRTAIDFIIPICKIYSNVHNYNVGHLYEHSNLTFTCPIKRGTYYMYNVVPDPSDFPPLLLAGRWKIIITFKDTDELVSKAYWICRVEY